MRQIVRNTFGRPITIELLEKLQLPTSNSSTTTNTTTTQITNANIVNQSLLNQQHHQQNAAPLIQQPLYTTVQPQQKINILQTPQQTLIGSTASLLSQQQQQQQQARTQFVIDISLILKLIHYINFRVYPAFVH